MSNPVSQSAMIKSRKWFVLVPPVEFVNFSRMPEWSIFLRNVEITRLSNTQWGIEMQAGSARSVVSEELKVPYRAVLENT
jgi:hypothetical protein